MRMKIGKRDKRNIVSQLFHAKNDKDAIAAWSSELDRILDVFNVRSDVYISPLLLNTADRPNSQ